MINFCSYKINSQTQNIAFMDSSLQPQKLIPFNNKTKSGWCPYHKRWELVTIAPDNKMYFSCGMALPADIGLNKKWNKNQYEFLVDTDNFVLRVNERWSWIDIHDNQIYEMQKVNSKIIDFYRGSMCHNKNFDLVEVPPEISRKIFEIAIGIYKRMYGIDFHIERVSLKDFIKYPTCPEFNGISKKVDDVNKYNFRADVNLFRDFCKLMQIKETKALRKDFHKNPNLLLLHAMAMYIGFTNSNAIRTFVSNPKIYDKFAVSGHVRFSIRLRSIYSTDSITFLDSLRLWVQNARTDKSETVVVQRLIKFLTDTDLFVVRDAADIYYENARNLPVAFHERILKEGFTNQMHDQLVQYFGINEDDGRGGFVSDSPKVKNEDIPYDTDILKFEDFIEGFSEEDIKFDYESVKQNRLMMLKAEKRQQVTLNIDNAEENVIDDDADENYTENPGEEVEDIYQFKSEEPVNKEIKYSFELGSVIRKNGNNNSYYFALPRTTDELYEISLNMRNCVGYLYRKKVLNQESIIIVLINRGKMCACIEIQQNQYTFHYEIVQALGPANRSINRRYSPVIESWKSKHDIGGIVNYRL